jgi:hypothetical protein
VIGHYARVRRTHLIALLIGVAAAVGAFAAAALTDESVVVDGQTVHCTPSELDDLPAEVDDRCDAQGDDRRRQAILAAAGAGVFAMAATALVLRRALRA